MPPRHCSNCGNALHPGDRFCQRCGSPVDAGPILERPERATQPKEAAEGFANGAQRRSRPGAVIAMGIGALLIAAAVGYGALVGGAPAFTAEPAASTPTAARELTAMVPGPAVLQDRLVYVRSATSTVSSATAIPKDVGDTFLVVVFTLPANSSLYPEDFDWMFRDGTGREFMPVGVGIPLKYGNVEKSAAVFTILGRLIRGPAVVTSKSDSAVIGLTFVVPKGTTGGTLSNSRKQTFTFAILPTDFMMEYAQISAIEFSSSMIEQLDGSESWTVTP